MENAYDSPDGVFHDSFSFKNIEIYVYSFVIIGNKDEYAIKSMKLQGSYRIYDDVKDIFLLNFICIDQLYF